MFSQLDYRTADLFMEGVDMVADVTNMPEIGSDTCDILICSHVLEHVPDDRQALAELYRVLKPGGWAIVMVPIILAAKEIDEDPHVTDVAERWRRFGQFDHVRLYSKRGFISRVEGAGFALEQLGVGYFGRAVLEECGIASRSVLYIAEKQD
jgi:SAM-dependent methyltransferase